MEPMADIVVNTLPLCEKYRPKTLDDVISHSEVVKTLKKFIMDSTIPHLLFHGPPGTGKTTCILALAKQVIGDQYKANILELNASDDRGIDTVRDQIKTFCETQQFQGKSMKFVILDECDAMTGAAQSALRRIIEKYCATTRFFLTCNMITKIIPPIVSRCTRFKLPPLKRDVVADRLMQIAKIESLNLDIESARAIYDTSDGDMRKCMNILESCQMVSRDRMIITELVYSCTGKPDPKSVKCILNSLLNDSYDECLKSIVMIRLYSI